LGCIPLNNNFETSGDRQNVGQNFVILHHFWTKKVDKQYKVIHGIHLKVALLHFHKGAELGKNYKLSPPPQCSA